MELSISLKEKFGRGKMSFRGKIGFYVMEPYQSIEIDSEFDWIIT